MALLIPALPIMAQQGEISEYFQGKIDGQRDGKSSSKILWLAGGCLLGPLGILIGYILPPSVPGDRLIGKSPEYVQGYTEGYREKGREQNALWAAGGYLIQSSLLSIYVVLLMVGAAKAFSY